MQPSKSLKGRKNTGVLEIFEGPEEHWSLEILLEFRQHFRPAPILASEPSSIGIGI